MSSYLPSNFEVKFPILVFVSFRSIWVSSNVRVASKNEETFVYSLFEKNSI